MTVPTWRRFDFFLLALTFALIAYGLAVIYSATLPSPGHSRSFDDPAYRQLMYGLFGLALTLLVANVDYHFLSRWAIPIYLLALGLLAVVLVIGQATHGAQRWIDLRFFPLQPAEPAKLALIFILAKYWTEQSEHVGRPGVLIGSLILVGIPALVTFLQPDLGTSVIFLVIWLGMAIVAGVRWLHLLMLGLVAILSSPFLWLSLRDYMRERVLVFLNPDIDPLGAAYNMRQALISVGSGGLLGQGFGNGSQSQLDFLRVQYTDFAFAVLGEELGFLGTALLLLVFLLLLLRATRTAMLAQDTFGRLVAMGIATSITFQALANIAMNVGLLPVVGVPLPFISYGGSSLITTLLAIGILESIAMRPKRSEY
ncbi:MAG: rod shape-determining protein RodA [Chloroflexi bacterium]|nr:rod shape-determining protein RodA [Chloroflexota bacterium]